MRRRCGHTEPARPDNCNGGRAIPIVFGALNFYYVAFRRIDACDH
jgi:hypothetical protein